MKTPIKLNETERDSVRRIVAASWLLIVSAGQAIQCRWTSDEILNGAKKVATDVDRILNDKPNP